MRHLTTITLLNEKKKRKWWIILFVTSGAFLFEALLKTGDSSLCPV